MEAKASGPSDPNSQENLNKDPSYFIEKLNGKWPKKNTAILINHGIGSQKPIETLDTFSRGIIKALQTFNPDEFGNITLEHHLQPKKSGDESYYWFDNFIRITNPNKDNIYIDIYEYYWANRTEDKTNYAGIMSWLTQVVQGAKAHYKNNKALVRESNDRSFFIDKNGNLNFFRYFLVLRVLGSLGILIHFLMSTLTKYIRYIPVVGSLLASLLESFKSESISQFSNVVGYITIYNDPNPRSLNQNIRKEILNGCVKAIRFLLEPVKENSVITYRYDKVLIAGHSLGSQISFDAMNRITHQVNLDEMDGYNSEGYRLFGEGTLSLNINQVLDTYITFGSPLDKIAFFFREQSEAKEAIRQQILENFHSFKQRPWNIVNLPKPVQTSLLRIFDNITWRNYHDNKDYVSGGLDYYRGLTNVNCNFNKGFFTHSNYWDCNEFFGDVLITIF